MRSDTRRAGRVYMLFAFHKKAKRGIATPQTEIDPIKRRLKQAVGISECRE